MKKKKNLRLVIILTSVVVVLIGGWFWYTSAEITSTNDVDVSDILTIHPDDLTKGNPQAKAVLIEYGDFQCGACKVMYERLGLVWRVVQDDLYFVYRHYPLSQHQHARVAARYAEAMKRQDKFWPFHDLVYNHQQEWEKLPSNQVEAMFKQFVVEVGGDVDQLQSDLNDAAIDKKIDRDMSLGERSGLTGTPTLLLNGNKIPIPNNLSQFVSEIKELNQ